MHITSCSPDTYISQIHIKTPMCVGIESARMEETNSQMTRYRPETTGMEKTLQTN